MNVFDIVLAICIVIGGILAAFGIFVIFLFAAVKRGEPSINRHVTETQRYFR